MKLTTTLHLIVFFALGWVGWDKVWPVTRQDAALLTLAAAWPGQGSRSYSLSPSLPRRHKDKALSVTRQDAALLTLKCSKVNFSHIPRLHSTPCSCLAWTDLSADQTRFPRYKGIACRWWGHSKSCQTEVYNLLASILLVYDTLSPSFCPSHHRLSLLMIITRWQGASKWVTLLVRSRRGHKTHSFTLDSLLQIKYQGPKGQKNVQGPSLHLLTALNTITEPNCWCP